MEELTPKQEGAKCRERFIAHKSEIDDVALKMCESLNTKPLVLIPCRVKKYGDAFMIAVLTGPDMYCPIAFTIPYDELKNSVDEVLLLGEHKLVSPKDIPGFAEYSRGDLWNPK